MKHGWIKNEATFRVELWLYGRRVCSVAIEATMQQRPMMLRIFTAPSAGSGGSANP